MNIFISHSHANADEGQLAEFISRELTRKSHQVFIDTQIKAGDDWVSEIDRNLKKCNGFVVLPSQYSVSSEMVQAEVRLAHRYRKQGKKTRIIPIRVRYDGPLEYELESYLGRIHHLI